MSEDLTWMPAWKMRELIVAREISPVEVTDHFLSRISTYDGKLAAFAHVDAAGARLQAKRAEQALSSADGAGPLHGVPVSVKAGIAIEGVPSGPISGTGEPNVPTRDGLIVERLRAAGAIVFGVNTSGVPFDALEEWQALARNPWDTNRTSGWSSSGGGSAAGAALVPVAIGGDGAGSTRIPAAYSGVVGIHTSPGLIPSVDFDKPSTFLPLGSRGPLCRSAKDAAVVLNVLAGPDGRDMYCRQDRPPDYVAAFDEGIDRLRLAWTDHVGSSARFADDKALRVIAFIRDAAEKLSALGATVDRIEEVWEDYWEAQSAMVAALMPGAPIRKVPDAGGWAHAIETRGRTWRQFRRIFDRHDYVLSPTVQQVAPTIEEGHAAYRREKEQGHPGTIHACHFTYTGIYNCLGFPALSLPCGLLDGLPVGLQIAGAPGSEPGMLRVARAYQEAFPITAKPTLD